MFLLPGGLKYPLNPKELERFKYYKDENGEIKGYTLFIGTKIEELLKNNLDFGMLNQFFSIEINKGKDGELFNIGNNTYIKGTKINQRIIFSAFKEENTKEKTIKRGDYISPNLDNHPTDLNGLKQLDEDIYLFSMNKRQAIFTSKFKENIKYIEVDGIYYALGMLKISKFIWIYSLTENKRIFTDKDKILELELEKRYGNINLKVKRINKNKVIGEYINL